MPDHQWVYYKIHTSWFYYKLSAYYDGLRDNFWYATSQQKFTVWGLTLQPTWVDSPGWWRVSMRDGARSLALSSRNTSPTTCRGSCQSLKRRPDPKLWPAPHYPTRNTTRMKATGSHSAIQVLTQGTIIFINHDQDLLKIVKKYVRWGHSRVWMSLS